jgi:hypothetical protein
MAISPSTDRRRDGSTRSRRWIAVLLATVLLHLIAFQWADGRLGLPMPRPAEPAVVTTALLSEAPPPPPVAAPASRPRPKVRKKSVAAPAPVPASPPPPAVTVETTEPAGIEAPGSSVEEVASAQAESATEAAPSPAPPPAAPAEAAEQAARRYKVDPPPSAELKYEVRALREGKNWYGSGLFRWEAAGGSYRITGEASVSFLFNITVLNFKSEGALNEYGVAPVLYSEKPWRKALTNTHFQHANHKISFSASEAVYPWHGGEQDRASIMWQLAAIGRGDAAQFTPGADIDMVVAGARDADTWRIRVLGQEDVDTPYGKLAAWHVVRAPRQGSYDQTIDIWLAPQREWYPVRLRYTYANGDYLDMTLSGMTSVVR